LDASPKQVRFNTSARHDGSAHVECVGGEFNYVVTERGNEFERRRTVDPQELLFWLVSDLTWEMAAEWELQHRIEGEDFRRQLFRRDIELISRIDPEWARRKREKYEKILGEYPFNDRKA
jgi:hypothetical protein